MNEAPGENGQKKNVSKPFLLKDLCEAIAKVLPAS